MRNETYTGTLIQNIKTKPNYRIDKLIDVNKDEWIITENHHEPIISEELFATAQELLNRRAKSKLFAYADTGKREKFSRQYAFSCMLECGYCGSNLSRRSWHSNSTHQKTIWQCVVGTKRGKKYCQHSKGIPEATIEKAFLEAYNIMTSDNKDVLNEFIKRIEDTLGDRSKEKALNKITEDIQKLNEKKHRLLDMHLEGTLDKETFQEKLIEIDSQLDKLKTEKGYCKAQLDEELSLKRRTDAFKKTLAEHKTLEQFDRLVFESIVSKVIIGGIDEAGNNDPHSITFVFKTGMTQKIMPKPTPKGKSASKQGENAENTKLCSHAGNDDEKICSNRSVDTRGDNN